MEWNWLFTTKRWLILGPRVCRDALWDLLLKWGCDPSLLRVRCCMVVLLKQLGFTVVFESFVLERGLREGSFKPGFVQHLPCSGHES